MTERKQLTKSVPWKRDPVLRYYLVGFNERGLHYRQIASTLKQLYPEYDFNESNVKNQVYWMKKNNIYDSHIRDAEFATMDKPTTSKPKSNPVPILFSRGGYLKWSDAMNKCVVDNRNCEITEVIALLKKTFGIDTVRSTVAHKIRQANAEHGLLQEMKAKVTPFHSMSEPTKPPVVTPPVVTQPDKKFATIIPKKQAVHEIELPHTTIVAPIPPKARAPSIPDEGDLLVKIVNRLGDIRAIETESLAVRKEEHKTLMDILEFFKSEKKEADDRRKLMAR